MTERPLVSVITIFLNEEKFIQDAIESVFAQSYDNWELLLVDDGSNDESTAMAQRYHQQCPRKVHYLEHPGHENRGMSESRNLALNRVRGEHIAFLDADDVWMPNKLEEQLAILRSNPDAAMVCGRAQFWYSWTGNPADQQRDSVQQLDVPLNTLVRPPQLLILFLRNEWASLCDILMRREVLEAIGGYEGSFRGMYEDQVFNAKLCLNFPAFVSSGSWYRYRQHEEACTFLSNKAGQYYETRQAFLIWLRNYLAKQGMRNTEVWKVLREELWSLRHPRLLRIAGQLQRVGRQTKILMEKAAPTILPAFVRRWLRAQWRTYSHRPPLGRVRFGSLRRVTPISREFGFDRGLPIDRYYIERFLALHAEDIRGHVLEVQDAMYTRRFGAGRVSKSDVLHALEGNPAATIVADLTCADQIPSNTFECIILTQTLLFIYDVRAAIKTLYRTLKPGGVLLVTVPGITQSSREDVARWGQYWSFTTQSIHRLFREIFPVEQVQVKAYGNVLAATAFLYGVAAHELREQELDYRDPDYEVVITVRAVKAIPTC